MDFISQDTLTLAKVARAWADEPGALPQEEILQRLLDAYWSGEFEQLRDTADDSNWPDPIKTLRILEFCGGVPWHQTEISDDEKPVPGHLVKISIAEYPQQGRAILESLDLPRDMIESWCLSKSIPLPAFWFEAEQNRPKRPPGRPSSMEKIRDQLELRAKRNTLASTVAEESRELAAWADKNLGPGEPRPKPRSIGNAIRDRYKQLKPRD